MKRLANILIVALFLTALGLTAYPFVCSALFAGQSKAAIRTFYTVILPPETTEDPAEEPDSTQEVRPYAGLYEAMQEYNEQLWASRQAGLDGADAYEAAALDVAAFLGTDTIGVISIPAMDVELPLYLGASEKHMTRGAVILGSTSCPIGGANTNCVIAAHRGYRGIPYFREIERLSVGDAVFLTNPWETLEYRVTGWEVVQPDSIQRVLIRPGWDMVTLVTCHPYRVGTQRYLVFCERVCEEGSEGEADGGEREPTLSEQSGEQVFFSSEEEIRRERWMQWVGLGVTVGVVVAVRWLRGKQPHEERNQ